MGVDLFVECKVLDGVLPLQDQQQGYGDTHTVYMVYNTQDKQYTISMSS